MVLIVQPGGPGDFTISKSPGFFILSDRLNSMSDEGRNGKERRSGFMMDAELRLYLDGMKKDFIDAIKGVENHIKELVETQLSGVAKDNERQAKRLDELHELDRIHRRETAEVQKEIANNNREIEGRLSSLETNQVSRRFLVPILVTIGIAIIGAFATILLV